jgi:hypothetical protein
VAFGRAFCSCSSSSSSPSGLPTTLTSSRSSFGTCHIIGETDNKNGKGMGVVIRFSALGSGYADVAMHSTGFAVIDTPPSCTHSPTSGLFPPWTGSLTHPLVAEVLLLENTPHVLLNTYVEQLLFFFLSNLRNNLPIRTTRGPSLTNTDPASRWRWVQAVCITSYYMS